ncbi:hypothetical protein UP09_03310 [Bradyrhizobium sp. LTSP885]|uniref:hypothetical protein n=1 Tax=Bradyrhizobium sp. LTSP885 TaxID=1619232 RepID=UPI0005CA0C32|nr:hypothetical protein [Bradyrhizobium sp. LTSP885]KJC51086.1 hypothetical protein UP09_03310 [Bradyrhizobium sp. LTSP885]
MTTEVTATEKALAAQGATTDNLDPGATGTSGAPVAPAAPSNEPPAKKEGIDETNTIVADKPADPAAIAAAAAKAAEEKATAEAAAKEAAGPLKSYSTFPESPAAQAAVNLLKEAGLGPNAANDYFAKAIKTGDLNDIDVAGLEAKLGKDKATLVLAGVHAHYNTLAAASQATVKQTHEIFGGEDNWGKVKTWAQTAEKADPKLKAQIDDIRSLLDEGGGRAAAGARELLRLYNAGPDNKGLGTNKLVTGDSTGSVIGTALTRSAYITELKAAHERNATPQEIASIDARRRSGKAAGI